MARTLATITRARGRLAALLCAALGLTALLLASSGVASISGLEAKLSAGREEAGALAGALQSAQAELAAAEGEAAKASARERKLTGLLATGEEKAARLAAAVRRTQHRLALEKRRLRRARAALAARLVAIYESGAPSTASVILAADSIDELAIRTEYLERIQQSDSDLALRVAEVRRTVAAALHRVAALKARIDAYNERLAAARSEVASVRAAAEAAAAQLQTVEASRQASLAKLKASMGRWVAEIQAAKAARAERISTEEAEGEVERWLGGPYSIPAYIVMCESGGNYGAVNPSSGAGGAYQILPSTWKLYGGQGEPQNAPKAEQDRIAAEIWADSGPSAWVCG
ncbi:MAG TPA: transglycosylase family protein [Solirubrobacterales bacterium]|nr:transglycosylase family protein [Solirubrobacterales bacterium]